MGTPEMESIRDDKPFSPLIMGDEFLWIPTGADLNQGGYGADNTYKKLMDALISEFGKERVHFFAYDWRLSGEENTDILGEYINELTTKDPKIDKVTLVTHSTGGLLASSYIARNNGENKNKIDKFVSIATPFLGSPKAVYVFATGNFLPFNFASDSIKKMSSHMPGTYQLLPPSWVDRAYIFRQTSQYDQFWTPIQYPHNFVRNNMELINCDNEAVSYDVKGNFLEQASEFQMSMFVNSDSFQHILQDMSNVYFITGSSRSTINELYFDSAGRIVGRIGFADGDGTVPSWSATNENKFVITAFNADHTAIVKDSLCISWVLDILKGSFSTPPPPPNRTGHQIIRIACPVDVLIEHNGEILTNSVENFNSVTSWGSLYVIGENNEVKIVALDTDEPITIKLIGTDTGTMDYSIEYLDEDFNLLTSFYAVDVPITKDTKIITTTNQNSGIALEIDSNGDGIVDEIRKLDSISSKPNSCTIIAAAKTGGKASGGGAFDKNSFVTVTAISDTGYTFDGWYENNIKVSENESYSFTVTLNRMLVAKFAKSLADINIVGVSVGNKQANVDFDILSANGKGYSVYLSTNDDESAFKLYADVNYNSKGVHIRGLTNGETYYVYITYSDSGSILRSNVIKFTVN